MKLVVLSIFLVNLFSASLAQEFDNDKTSLLTSTIWKTGDEKEMIILYKFNKDGTFFRTTTSTWLATLDPYFSKPMDDLGKWEWTSSDTFTMQTTQTIRNDEMKNLNPEPFHKVVYKIQYIDLKIIKGIKYNILESEDSEYVNQFKWVVKD